MQNEQDASLRMEIERLLARMRTSSAESEALRLQSLVSGIQAREVSADSPKGIAI